MVEILIPFHHFLFDLFAFFRTSELVQLPGADQQLPLRALAFDGPGKLLLAAGDSKICCVWDCASWNVVLRT